MRPHIFCGIHSKRPYDPNIILLMHRLKIVKAYFVQIMCIYGGRYENKKVMENDETVNDKLQTSVNAV